MKRKYKGNSLLEFPDSFIVLDIETTGLSPEYDSIIEIGALKIEKSVVVNQFESLIRPNSYQSDGLYIDSYIESLTGITNKMLVNAPTISDVLPKFYNFIGDSILVGHNVNFDINFLYDYFENYLQKPLSNDFIDAMRLSRIIHPEHQHHRLKDLIERYSIVVDSSHRSIADCTATLAVANKLSEEIIHLYGDVNSFLISRKKHHCHKSLNANDIHTTNTEFDIEHPLYGKVCVFTGTLQKMLRKDAMQIVSDLGGTNGNSVTKKTNYLILGNNDYCSTIIDGKSSKQKKAEKLKLEGNDIEIIPENVFYDMIEN